MKPRLIVLLSVALIVFGVFGYKTYLFKQDVKQQRAAHSLEFLEKFHVYKAPTPESKKAPLEAFAQNDFIKLEELAKSYYARKSDPGDGREDITIFYRSLGAAGNKSNRLQQIKTAQEWRKAFPDSIVARIVQASLQSTYAWDARGNGFSRSVSDEQFKVFHSRLMESVKILTEISRAKRKEHPQCYAEMITCAAGLGMPLEKRKQLYEEAVSVAPQYVEIHYIAAHFTTPQWRGKPGKWEENLREQLKQLPKDAADRVYAATIYRMISRGHELGRSYDSVMRPANIDPYSLIRGIELLLEDSPKSIYFLTALAHAKMRHENDPVACRDAYEKTGWKIDLRIWQNKEYFDEIPLEWLDRRYKAYNADIDEYESDNSPLKIFGTGD